MTTCTFDSVTVPSREISRIVMQGSYYFECTLLCRDTALTNYSSLANKCGATMSPGTCAAATVLENGKTAVQSYGGTCGSLVLNGTTYTNCYISSLSVAEMSMSHLGAYEFTITFVKDTSA